MTDSLILEVTENGEYLVNGIEVSEETFEALYNDLDEDVVDIEIVDDEEECEFCNDINFIIDFVKNEDRDDAFDMISDVLEDYFIMGRVSALEGIADACDDELDEIYDVVDEIYEDEE